MQQELTGPPPCIEQDLACWRCRYNLRGLRAVDRCPECGTAITESIDAELWRHRTLAETDPRWLSQLLEGAWLALAVWFIVLALCLLPEDVQQWLSRRHAPQRVWLLGIVSTWWTLSWAAVWKLSRPEPRPKFLVRKWDIVFSWLIRVAATVYLLFPALHAWNDWMPRLPRMAEGIWAWSILCAAVVVGLALWLRVFALARLARNRWMQAQAVILALASPMVMWLALLNFGRGPSSIDFMFSLALPGLGWPWAIGEIFVEFTWDLHPGVWLLVLLHALLLITVIQLLLMLMRARRDAREDAHGRSAAMSGP